MRTKGFLTKEESSLCARTGTQRSSRMPRLSPEPFVFFWNVVTVVLTSRMHVYFRTSPWRSSFWGSSRVSATTTSKYKLSPRGDLVRCLCSPFVSSLTSAEEDPGAVRAAVTSVWPWGCTSIRAALCPALPLCQALPELPLDPHSHLRSECRSSWLHNTLGVSAALGCLSLWARSRQLGYSQGPVGTSDGQSGLSICMLNRWDILCLYEEMYSLPFSLKHILPSHFLFFSLWWRMCRRMILCYEETVQAGEE